MKLHLIFAVCACALGSGFQHGYNTGIVNTSQQVMETFINRTQLSRDGKGFDRAEMSVEWSVAASVFCLGAMFGSLLTSFAAEKFGRKKSLQVNNIVAVVGGLIAASANSAASYELIVLGRLLIGINTGLNAGLAPIYLVEISPIFWRGAMGSTYQLAVATSILISEVIGLPNVLGTSVLWPSMFALVAIPAILQTIALYFCPETPQFIYANSKNVEEAQSVLIWLRQVANVEDELRALRFEIDNALPPTTNVRIATGNRPFCRLLAVSLVIVLSRQLCGIHMVVFFSTDLFIMAGLNRGDALYATLGIGFVQIPFTILGVYLVERCGRRPLYMGGLLGLIISSVSLSTCLVLRSRAPSLTVVAVILLFFFSIVYAAAVGSIPWFIVSEIFDSSARSLANGIAVAVNWFTNFVVVLTYLPLEDALSGYVFFVYALFLSICFPYIYREMPETKRSAEFDSSANIRSIVDNAGSIAKSRIQSSPVILLNVSQL